MTATSGDGLNPAAIDVSLEREKWQADVRLRERELTLKEQELQLGREQMRLKYEEEQKARWSNPLVLAILGAAIAAGGNAAVAYVNGVAQRSLERERAATQELVEEKRAEATRILEMIKTDNAEASINNLKFLAETGLISNKVIKESIIYYVNNINKNEAPVLSPLSRAASAGPMGTTTYKLYDDQEYKNFLDEFFKSYNEGKPFPLHEDQ